MSSAWMTRAARESVQRATEEVRDRVTDGREKSLALTKLEEADMWLRRIEDRQREAELGEDD